MTPGPDDFELTGPDPLLEMAKKAHRMVPASRMEEWRSLAHDLRPYAQHAPMCNYRPTYPESPVATCDCAFDALLDRYDRLSAT